MFTREQLDFAYEAIIDQSLTALEMLVQKNRSFNLNAGKHCKNSFCSAIGKCREYSKYITKEAGIDVEKLVKNVTDNPDKEIKEIYSPDEIGNILTAIPLLKSKFSALEKDSLNSIVAGKTIPGWKVVRGRTRRKWIPDTSKIVKKLKEIGYKQTPYKKETLKNFGDIEKVLGKGSIDELLVAPKEGALKLVVESDKDVLSLIHI